MKGQMIQHNPENVMGIFPYIFWGIALQFEQLYSI